MPRKQTESRALRRLTSTINGFLYNKGYIDSILDIRSRLKIDVQELQKIAKDSLAEVKLPYLSTIHSAGARVEALARYLLKRHLIGKKSAHALATFRCWADQGRFWDVVCEADEKTWCSNDFYYVPRHYLVGGLCFDITKYINEYGKQEFCDLTNELLEMTKGGWEIDKSIFEILPNDLEEYAYYHMYMRLSTIESNLLWWDENYFSNKNLDKSIASWKKFVGSAVEAGVWLNVTELFLDDIEFYWHHIQITKELVGAWAYEALPRGRRKGINRSRKSGLRGLTWQKLRNQIRENPKDLNKLWNESVNTFGRHSPLMRRRARDNFYKQIIVHPDMLDLKLQLRKRGRPRKSLPE